MLDSHPYVQILHQPLTCLSFADIERKASQEEGKKSKKEKTCTIGIASPRRRNNFAEAKQFAKAKRELR